jgi:hypothetical protein
MKRSSVEGMSRIIDVGPAGFHPLSAMELGVTHPESGWGLLYGRYAPQDEVVAEAARQRYTRKNPTIFPGLLYLWAPGMRNGLQRGRRF